MTEQTGTELLYRYAIPSQVRRADDGRELLLGTSGGVTTETTEGPVAHPYLFRGFLTRPAPAAAGMLACAAIARARYYHAPGSKRDPVVTSGAPGHVRDTARRVHLPLVGQAPRHPRPLQARPRGPEGGTTR
jgi:hypothetical protein